MPSFLETVLPSLFTTLVVLDISSCNLSSLPEELTNLFVLEELNVSNNPLGSLPDSLSQLHTLRQLIANEIGCSSLPSSFAALQNLHTLCLRRNRLLALPGWLSLLPNMERLLVEDNPFAGPWGPLVEQMLVQWSPGGEPMEQHRESTSGASRLGSTPNTDSFYLANALPLEIAVVIPPSPAASANGQEPLSPGGSQSNYHSFPSPVTASHAPRSAPLQNPHSHNSYQPSTENRTAALASRRPSLPQGMTGGIVNGRFRSTLSSSDPPPLPDAPSQATIRGHPPLPPQPAEPAERPPVVRRMKSAGALFHLGSKDKLSSSRPSSPAPTEGLSSSRPSFVSSGIGLGAPPPRPPQKRFASMGRQSGSHAVAAFVPTKGGADEMEELDGEDSPPLGKKPSTPSGERDLGPVEKKEKTKWGFLKKMSMGRMRSGSGSGSSIRPPPPLHSNTAPVLDLSQRSVSSPGLPTRPSTSMGYSSSSSSYGNANGPSTSSLSSSDTPPAVSNSKMGPSSSAGYLGLPSSASTSRQKKRRSYLPLDMPPSLNIPIPSTSPFMSSVSTFSSTNHFLPSAMAHTSEDDSDGDDDADSASILESYLQNSPLESPTMTFQPSTNPNQHSTSASSAAEDDFRQASYLAGLRKVMGYLRDLHDLSIPPTLSSNAPIDGSTGLDTPASHASQFSATNSPSPAMMMSSASSTPPPSSSSKSRSRRPTIGGGSGGGPPPEMKRDFSEGSMMISQPSPGLEGGRAMSMSAKTDGSDESSERMVVEQRKYKEDKVKRAKVVQEIVE